MADFDPYSEWLGISPEERPASYYRLLGIPPFEPDSSRIESAAVRQTERIRAYQLTEPALASRLLNEVTAAYACLRNPGKKARYDQQLRARSGGDDGRTDERPVAAETADWFFRVGSGWSYGPVAAAVLRQKAADGEILPDTLVRKGADGRWVRAEDVRGLFQLSGLFPTPSLPQSKAEPRSHTAASAVQRGPCPPSSPPPLPVTIASRCWGRVRRIKGLLLAGALAAGVMATSALLLWISPSHDGPERDSLVPGSRLTLDGGKKASASADSASGVGGGSARKPGGPGSVQLSASEIYDSASPAVVKITVENEAGEEIASGSGFFVNDKELGMLADSRMLLDSGQEMRFDEIRLDATIAESWGMETKNPTQARYVLTNSHVLKGAVTARLTLLNGDVGEVREVWCEDWEADLALLKAWVFSNASLPTLELADEVPPVGATVFAIGAPRGLEGSLSSGEISGHREVEGTRWLQTTAPISPGSSGGPLLLSNGRVVGVATATRTGGQNLNFAVPVDILRTFLRGPSNSRSLWEGASFRKEETSAVRCFGSPEPSEAQYLVILAHTVLRDKQPRRAIEAAEDALRVNLGKEPLHTWSIPSNVLQDDASRASLGKDEYLVHFIIGEARKELAREAISKGGRLMDGEDLKSAMHRIHRGHPDFRAGIDSLEKAAALNPKFSPTYASLCGAYSCCGRDADALTAADRLVQLVPKCSEAYRWRGFCYRELGQLQRALQDYETAAELNPKDSRVYFAMGEIYADLDMHDKAVVAYQTGLELRADWGYYLKMGFALQKLGRFAEAILAFEEARATISDDDIHRILDRAISECRAKQR